MNFPSVEKIIDRLFSPIALLPVICIYGITFMSIIALSKDKKFKLQTVKYEALDGLKGYLSIVVFISHGSVWYYFLRTKQWPQLPSMLFAQLGQASILIFFMMTGFLFGDKLMANRTSWMKLYISRILRLFPLYLVALLVVFFIVAVLSNFSLDPSVSGKALIEQLFIWVTFTLMGNPDINKVHSTWIIVSGVTWTLKYEWIFYFSLPVLSLLMTKNKNNIIAIVLSVFICFYFTYFFDFDFIYFTPFLGGILAALLIRSSKFSDFAKSKIAGYSLIALMLSLIITLKFITIYNFFPFIIMTGIFIIVACGNNLFGILNHKVGRRIGQISYGIYLFHGIVFFVFFKFVLGYEVASGFSSLQHWLCISLLTPIIVTVAYMLHIFLEIPAIKVGLKLNTFIQDKVVNFKRKEDLHLTEAP